MVSMTDVKQMDCEICGCRMNYMRSDDDTEIMIFCDEKHHPEYTFDLDLTNDEKGE